MIAQTVQVTSLLNAARVLKSIQSLPLCILPLKQQQNGPAECAERSISGSEGVPRTRLFHPWTRWNRGPVAEKISTSLSRDRVGMRRVGMRWVGVRRAGIRAHSSARHNHIYRLRSYATLLSSRAILQIPNALQASYNTTASTTQASYIIYNI